LKVAPEHTVPDILKLMGKPQAVALLNFKRLFEKSTESSGKKLYLTYYFIAAYPGCTEEDMHRLKSFAGRELKTTPVRCRFLRRFPPPIPV